MLGQWKLTIVDKEAWLPLQGTAAMGVRAEVSGKPNGVGAACGELYGTPPAGCMNTRETCWSICTMGLPTDIMGFPCIMGLPCTMGLCAGMLLTGRVRFAPNEGAAILSASATGVEAGVARALRAPSRTCSSAWLPDARRCSR